MKELDVIRAVKRSALSIALLYEYELCLCIANQMRVQELLPDDFVLPIACDCSLCVAEQANKVKHWARENVRSNIMLHKEGGDCSYFPGEEN